MSYGAHAHHRAAPGIDELVLDDLGDIAQVAVGYVHTGVKLIGQQARQAVGGAVAGKEPALQAGQVDELGRRGKDQLGRARRHGHRPRHRLKIRVGRQLRLLVLSFVVNAHAFAALRVEHARLNHLLNAGVVNVAEQGTLDDPRAAHGDDARLESALGGPSAVDGVHNQQVLGFARW